MIRSPEASPVVAQAVVTGRQQVLDELLAFIDAQGGAYITRDSLDRFIARRTVRPVAAEPRVVEVAPETELERRAAHGDL